MIKLIRFNLDVFHLSNIKFLKYFIIIIIIVIIFKDFLHFN
jgi:hypothetical protein